MKLVHLEGKMEGIKYIENRYKGTYNLEIKLVQDKINDLTNWLPTLELLNQWKHSSY